MKTALSFANELRAYEARFGPLGWGDHATKAEDLFFATILFLAASLEACLSETIQDYVDNRSIDQNSAQQLLESRKSLLDRYSEMLNVFGCQKLNKGNPPAQDVVAVIEMRDACMHYKPRFDDDAKESEFLEGLPLWRKGKPSAIFAEVNLPFFPHKCCNFYNAKLAIDSVRRFLQVEIVKKLGHSPAWLQEGRGGYGHPTWWPEEDASQD